MSFQILLFPKGIIRPVFIVAALTWFIRYIILLLKFTVLNNVIIIKINVLLPQAHVTLPDFGDHVSALWFTCSQCVLNYLALQPFDVECT
jgi:hypothetical protein